MTAPVVGIVLVNWNAVEDTVECLRSLQSVDYSPFFTIVVDNGSAEDPSLKVAAAAPTATVVRLPHNAGFAGGNNLGMAYALARGADYVLCLNNDTVVAPDFLNLLVRAVEADAHFGMATAAIYRYSEPTQLVALGCDIDLSSSPPAWQIVPSDSRLKVAHEVPFGEGCALMLARAVIETTGGFDNDFFAYAEDADLCLRARRCGWRCVVVPDARVWHKIDAKSSGHHSDTALFYFYRNAWHLVRRHATPTERQLFIVSHARLLRNEFARYLQARISTPSEASDRPPHGQFMPVLLGTLAGLFGWSGDRRRCASAERTLRLLLTPLVELTAVLIHRVYRRIRRKTRSAGVSTAGHR
jgi:GT2 family glycosyltransferase